MKKKFDRLYENPFILKSGATDLRRSGRTLLDFAAPNYKGGIKLNTAYFFCNNNQKTIKMAVKYANNDYYTAIRNNCTPFNWPEFVEKGNDGYIIELKGDDRKVFLNETGFHLCL
jgi:hypothetical protein